MEEEEGHVWMKGSEVGAWVALVGGILESSSIAWMLEHGEEGPVKNVRNAPDSKVLDDYERLTFA